MHAVVRLLLVVLGLSVPVLALEAALRTLGPIVPGNYETGVWAQGHSVVGHFHIPGATAWVREPEFTTFLRFNNAGLRGSDTRVPKPPERFRILLLGDSFVEAKQVAEESSVTEQLNNLFGAAGRSDVRALNAGVFDWSPVHELLYVENAGPELRPDLVVQFFYVGNDIGDLWPRSRGELRELEHPLATVDDDGELVLLPWTRPAPGERDTPLSALSRQSAVARMIETGVIDKFRFGARGGSGVDGHLFDLFRAREQPAQTRAWRTVEATLVETQQAVERMGAR